MVEFCDPNDIPEEPVPTVESIAARITDLSNWIRDARAELYAATKYKRILDIEVKVGIMSHYISPKNRIFDDRERLSKYWVRVVKGNIKEAKRELEEQKRNMVEALA